MSAAAAASAAASAETECDKFTRLPDDLLNVIIWRVPDLASLWALMHTCQRLRNSIQRQLHLLRMHHKPKKLIMAPRGTLRRCFGCGYVWRVPGERITLEDACPLCEERGGGGDAVQQLVTKYSAYGVPPPGMWRAEYDARVLGRLRPATAQGLLNALQAGAAPRHHLAAAIEVLECHRRELPERLRIEGLLLRQNVRHKFLLNDEELLACCHVTSDDRVRYPIWSCLLSHVGAADLLRSGGFPLVSARIRAVHMENPHLFPWCYHQAGVAAAAAVADAKAEAVDSFESFEHARVLAEHGVDMEVRHILPRPVRAAHVERVRDVVLLGEQSPYLPHGTAFGNARVRLHQAAAHVGAHGDLEALCEFWGRVIVDGGHGVRECVETIIHGLLCSPAGRPDACMQKCAEFALGKLTARDRQPPVPHRILIRLLEHVNARAVFVVLGCVAKHTGLSKRRGMGEGWLGMALIDLSAEAVIAWRHDISLAIERLVQGDATCARAVSGVEDGMHNLSVAMRVACAPPRARDVTAASEFILATIEKVPRAIASFLPSCDAWSSTPWPSKCLSALLQGAMVAEEQRAGTYARTLRVLGMDLWGAFAARPHPAYVHPWNLFTITFRSRVLQHPSTLYRIVRAILSLPPPRVERGAGTARHRVVTTGPTRHEWPRDGEVRRVLVQAREALATRPVEWRVAAHDALVDMGVRESDLRRLSPIARAKAKLSE